MEYFGHFEQRKLDSKRRMLFPAKWRSGEKYLFWVTRKDIDEDDIFGRLYTEKEWLQVRDAMDIVSETSGNNDAVDFFSRSEKLSFDTSDRVLLPKCVTCYTVDLVGCVDYIIVRMSKNNI